MFSSRIATVVASSGRRQMSSVGGVSSFLYNNVWRKSNAFYLTYITTGIVVLGAVYESTTEGIWRTLNRGVSQASTFCGSN